MVVYLEIIVKEFLKNKLSQTNTAHSEYRKTEKQILKKEIYLFIEIKTDLRRNRRIKTTQI